MTFKGNGIDWSACRGENGASPQEPLQGMDNWYFNACPRTKLNNSERCFQSDTRWCPLAQPTCFLFLSKEAKKANRAEERSTWRRTKRMPGFLS